VAREQPTGLRGDHRFAVVEPPRPRVAEPQRREHDERGLVRACVVHAEPDADVLRPRLRVVDGDEEVAAVVEDSRVDELVLGVEARPAAVLRDEVGVGELGLRIAVGPGHVGVGRRGVDVPPVLLRVLAVVALVSREAEDAFFQDRVPPVPEAEREAQPLVEVAYPAEPVLAPPVGARARVVVGEVLPRGPALAVVLADGAPGSFGEIGAEPAPGDAGLVEPGSFGVAHRASLSDQRAASHPTGDTAA